MRPAVADQRALGTAVRVAVTDAEQLPAASHAVDSLLREIDLACSRFRDDSELSRLNAAPGGEVEISRLLAQALAAALRAARLTGGLVDPTVGAAVRGAGYSVDFADVAPEGPAVDLVVRSVPGWRRIALHEASRRVRIPPGVELDLGATAKALAADLAAEAALQATGRGGVLVSLGGDISVAGEAPEEGWQIQVADNCEAPLSPDAETVCIGSGGMATSSTTVRRWVRGGIDMHHIIDPRTGMPAAGPWRTVSVCAGSCLDANTAATAALILGESAPHWLEAARLPARLVDRAGNVTRAAGWPSTHPEA